MAFPAWAPPRGMGDEAEGPAGGGLLKAGWENAGGGGGGGGGGDSASSFLQGLKRFSSVPQSTPPAAQAPATNNWQQQMHSMYSNPAPVGQPGFRASVSPAPHYPPAQAGGVDHQTPQGFSQPQAQGQPVVFESALLTEDEFQANSAIEYGSGIALSGCTIDRHLNDGDPMPQLESLSASVTLRITPTAIVFLHHYDRNFILEVPVSELYEINEDSEAKVVLLHTRSANGSALLELQCGSSRKRLGIYKTLCIRKNALERLKRQQQYLAKAHPSAQ